jgi:hypothetical protein
MSSNASPDKNATGFLARRPAIPVAVAFGFGILAHRSLPVAPIFWIISLAVLIAIAVLWIDRDVAAALAVVLATFSAGVAVAQLEAFYYPRDHISAFASDQPRLARLELHLDHPPRTLTWPYGQYRATPPKQVVTASLRRVKTWSGWVNCRGDVLVQIAQPHPRLALGQSLGHARAPRAGDESRAV